MWTDSVLRLLGDVVRVAPNEVSTYLSSALCTVLPGAYLLKLHFSQPSAYHDIYNPRNRWTKDPALYRIFAESESTFTIVEYSKAKKRKDILLPLFSRKAIIDMQHLIQDCVGYLSQLLSYEC